ncbi:RNA-binding protein 41-like isoform X2 [Oopsacas minuta]|uniref:RNA-binding protein 41-like isoform X2 n=1 Tax=Oopsacas minuta TaxID=111878 RepID=A0AAV7JXT2_9METZ|nr:RNA-binding protein 41-like isoform X2 [Oopsacas minuta]
MKRVDNHRGYLAKLKQDSVTISLTETEVRNLTAKQLDINPISLPFKTFISSSAEVFPLSSLEGITTASDYRVKLAKLEQESNLLHDGLSSEQVRIVMGQQQGARRGYPRDPSVREGDLNAIEDKIHEKHEFLQQQSSNTNSIKISRHEQELELSRNNSESNPLSHLLGTDNSKQSNQAVLLFENSLQAIECRRRDADRKRRRLDNNTRTCYKESELNSENPVNTPDDKLNTFEINELIPTYPSHVNNYRLSLPEINQIPRFSGYKPGNPSNKLFIKNLHRKVTLNQFASLFIKFQKIPGPSIKFRLLTGRMKGQAFVEFDSIASATEALYYVTGYILMGRPVIAVYASNTKY